MRNTQRVVSEHEMQLDKLSQMLFLLPVICGLGGLLEVAIFVFNNQTDFSFMFFSSDFCQPCHVLEIYSLLWQGCVARMFIAKLQDAG